MKAFAISPEQIARVIGAAAADELSRHHNRYFDFLTIASWTPGTKLYSGGLDLDENEFETCAKRVSEMFGKDKGLLLKGKPESLSDWATKIADGISQELSCLQFKAAARDGKSAPSNHCADEIFQDAAAAANLLYGRRRLLSFVAPHSLVGFQLSIITPNLLDIESVDVRGMTPEELSQTLRFGDVLVATPTLWRYMVREKLAAPDNTMAVTFGEAMTHELAADMRSCGFGAMREIYGSTETGLIGWRDAPDEHFILFDHWIRYGALLHRKTPSGEEKPVPPMDDFDWVGDRGFQLLGRRDGAVQIGAVNVIPSDVAKALCGHPKIEECKISVGKRGDGVSRLIAHIILKKDARPDEQTAREIDAWCRINLRQQERPRIYNFERAVN